MVEILLVAMNRSLGKAAVGANFWQRDWKFLIIDGRTNFAEELYFVVGDFKGGVTGGAGFLHGKNENEF